MPDTKQRREFPLGATSLVVVLLVVAVAIGYGVGAGSSQGNVDCVPGTILSIEKSGIDELGNGTYVLSIGDCDRIDDSVFVAAVGALGGVQPPPPSTSTTTTTTTTTVPPKTDGG